MKDQLSNLKPPKVKGFQLHLSNPRNKEGEKCRSLVYLPLEVALCFSISGTGQPNLCQDRYFPRQRCPTIKLQFYNNPWTARTTVGDGQTSNHVTSSKASDKVT